MKDLDKQVQYNERLKNMHQAKNEGGRFLGPKSESSATGSGLLLLLKNSPSKKVRVSDDTQQSFTINNPTTTTTKMTKVDKALRKLNKEMAISSKR